HQRFQSNRDKVRSLYDERFWRMWEFYLQLCEIGYRRLKLNSVPNSDRIRSMHEEASEVAPLVRTDIPLG
ncbi:MAG TPA: hypothetical protein VFV49_00345, partial [Thermoanaerobaculia bacterium]|nr:hypothetical protein [Thermoanaerobaculia bacterium]